VAERDTAVVPDSAWDRALAVVHDEVGRLPETLRIPFVLCVLDGRSVTEAAGHLRMKVNTVSVRLGRAKDALIARLNSRGLTGGVAVALAFPAAAAPAATLVKVAELVRGGGTIPASVHHLTQGVLGMTAKQIKLLAAGVLLTVGLGVGGGAGWLSTAGAQSQPNLYPRITPEERVKQLEAELEKAKKDVERAREQRRAGAYSTAKWQYEFVPAGEVDAEGFVKALQDREAGGWEFNGQTTLKKDGKGTAVWVFRRPVGGGGDGEANKLHTYPRLPDYTSPAKGVRP